MTNFMTMSDGEILDYIDLKFHLFTAAERSDDFPSALLGSLQRGHSFVIRRDEGFAMVRDGAEPPFNNGAELMFLHVLPEFEGRGIGQQLVEQVKTAVGLNVTIELICETARRRRFFERSGFLFAQYYESHDLYKMVHIWV